MKGGEIFPLTGYEGNLVIAITAGGDTEIEKEGVISNPDSGVIEFTLLPDDTKSAQVRRAKYEVNIWKTADKTTVFTPITGDCDILRGLDDDPTNK
jgi:hypothetical protein